MPADPISLTFTVVAITLIIIGAVFALTFMGLRRLARQRQQAMFERYPNARQVISGANFYGQHSKGFAQLRCNGTLVITDQALIFERWVPRAEFSVPLNRITSVELPTSFLGKTNFRPLLKVVYQTDTGEQDAMAWLTPDAAELKSLIEQLLP
jgi:hypothetical protein